MRLIPALFLTLFIASCASTYPSASQNYRPKNSADLWNITGSIDAEHGLTDKYALSVFIDGTQVISSPLHNDGYSISGESTGKYKDYSISSTCASRQTSAYNSQVSCIIFVDNERAATLIF